MAEVLLFHHAHGLTTGVLGFGDTLAAAGHAVHVPDLFEGLVFDELEQGLAYAQETGFGTILERGRAASDGLTDHLVYAGFSLGVLPAQMLAQTRAGAAGALLFYSCLPTSEFGDGWPDGVPVQIHAKDADPFFVDEGDLAAAHALVDQAAEGELFLYPGDEHLFADDSLPSYDEAATRAMTKRVLDFLDRVH